MRNNPGGYVGGALDIAEQLMPRLMFILRSKVKSSKPFRPTETGNLGLPVVLLIKKQRKRSENMGCRLAGQQYGKLVDEDLR